MAFPFSGGVWPVWRHGLPGSTRGQAELHHVRGMRAAASPRVHRKRISVRVGYVSHATRTSRTAWFQGPPSVTPVLSQALASRRDCRATGTTTARMARMKTATPETNPAVPWTFRATSRAGRRDTGKRDELRSLWKKTGKPYSTLFTLEMSAKCL